MNRTKEFILILYDFGMFICNKFSIKEIGIKLLDKVNQCEYSLLDQIRPKPMLRLRFNVVI